MLTVAARPMTPEERALLQRLRTDMKAAVGCRSGCAWHFICLVGGAVLGMLASVVPLAPFMLFGISIPQVVGQAVILCGTVIGFLLGLRLLLRERAEALQPYQRDLRDDRMDEIRCTVTSAVQLEPYEDEGTGYFLEVSDTHLLFLQGQYLDDLLDEGVIPARDLYLVRAPHSGTVVAFEWQGETFAPERVLHAEEAPSTPAVPYVPGDGEIIQGRLETLEADLHRLAQERRARA